MWLLAAVVVLVVLFLWREVRAQRRGWLSNRQLKLRFVLSGLLLALALLLQFREVLFAGIENASREVQILRIAQFLLGIFVLAMALLLVVLLDLRETVRYYAIRRKQMVSDLIQRSEDHRDADTS